MKNGTLTGNIISKVLVEFRAATRQFRARERTQNGEVAIQEQRDVRHVYHGESHNSRHVLVHLFLSSTRVPLL